ncbi:unannotated protein [freshwater metagenome]|uniref:Unannotated protein n=1 Tax=freshwater metagenome TaxID=449393 RepID=A0A6J6JC89_9ZZZZ
MARDGIPEINHIQVIKNLYAQVEVIGPRVIRISPKRSGTKACARSIGRAVIPRGANDRDVWLDGIELRCLSHKGLHTEGGDSLIRGRIKLFAHAWGNKIRGTHAPRLGGNAPD